MRLAATLEALSDIVYSRTDPIEDRAVEVLRVLGQYSRADRVSVFGLDVDRDRTYRRFMWAANPASAASAHEEPALSNFGGLEDAIEKESHRVFDLGSIETAPPAARAVFRERKLTAMVYVPLIDELGPRGLVSVQWTEEPADLETTVQIAKLVSGFLTSELARASDLDPHHMKELALDHTSDVVCVTRIDGRFVYLNAAGRRRVGVTPDGPLDGSFWDFLEPAAAAELREASRPSLREHGSWAGEITARFPDGTSVPMETIAHVHRDRGGRARFFSAIMRDASDRKAAQDRLHGLIEEKDRFVATVSHELRTPLTAVLGIVSELVDTPEHFNTQETRELLSLVRTQSNEMADIVSDLLVVARLEDDSVAIKSQPLDLTDEITSVMAVLGSDAIVEGTAGAIADPGRVRQIVRNLFTNALKYGGPRIRVCMSQDGGRALLQVRDNGAGIPAPAIERIFGPYERFVRAGGESGIGLGLFVSRSLARLMSGDLTYAREGDETVFTLELPGPNSSTRRG